MKKAGIPLLLLSTLLLASPLPAAPESTQPPQPGPAATEIQVPDPSLYQGAQKELANNRYESARLKKELESLKKEYEAWKVVNAKTMELKAAADRLTAQMEAAQTELQQARAENEKLSSRKNIYWFFAGAAVLAVGWMLGYAYGGSKKRTHHGGYRF